MTTISDGVIVDCYEKRIKVQYFFTTQTYSILFPVKSPPWKEYCDNIMEKMTKIENEMTKMENGNNINYTILILLIVIFVLIVVMLFIVIFYINYVLPITVKKAVKEEKKVEQEVLITSSC